MSADMSTGTSPKSGMATSVIATQRATYLKHLLTQASAAADESGLGLKNLREKAIAQVNARSFPAGRDEEWRFTDLSDMLKLPFERAHAEQAAKINESISESASTPLDLTSVDLA